MKFSRFATKLLLTASLAANCCFSSIHVFAAESVGDKQHARTFSDIQNRISGGEPVAINLVPWQVHLGIVYKDDAGSTWTSSCGGSLIHDQWVLTALHCIFKNAEGTKYLDASEIKVNYGSEYRNKQKPVSVIKVVPFTTGALKDWKPYDGIENTGVDIALLKLEHGIANEKADSPTRVINIPGENMVASMKYGKKAVISGWGHLKYKDDNLPNDLRAASITIYDAQACKERIAGAMYDSDLCAIEAGKDTCQGDSGGPIAVQDLEVQGLRSQYYLVGVTSRGFKCQGKESLPGIYVDTSKLKPWIEQVMKSN